MILVFFSVLFSVFFSVQNEWANVLTDISVFYTITILLPVA